VRVEHNAKGQFVTGRTADIGLGGILILSKDTLEPHTDVRVQFTLPAGHEVDVAGRVAHSTPAGRMGVSFLHLSREDQKAIAEYVEQIKPYKRRGQRIPRRISVVVSWRDYGGNRQQKPGETALLSQHGGTVLTPVRVKPGQNIFICRSDTGKEGEARVVFTRLSGAGRNSEIGFEFLEAENFWEMDFPPEIPLWEMKGH